MRRILAILDSNKSYAYRLAAYINDSGRCILKAIVISDASVLSHKDDQISIELLIVSEDMLYDARKYMMPEHVMVITDDGLIGSDITYPTIYRYTSADDIISQAMQVSFKKQKLKYASNKKSEIIAIYSPIGRCGKTSLSIALGLCKAKLGHTLLITFEEYRAIFDELIDLGKYDLSDYIYKIKCGDYSWNTIATIARTIEGLDIIPPATYAEDLSLMTPEDVNMMISNISLESNYETIIVDMGCFSKCVIDVLETCDIIYMPICDDDISYKKEQSFISYIKESGRESIISKLIRCKVPMIERSNHISDYAHSNLASYAETLSKERKDA